MDYHDLYDSFPGYSRVSQKEMIDGYYNHHAGCLMQIEILWAIHNIQMPCQMTWWSCRFMCLDAEKDFPTELCLKLHKNSDLPEKSQSLA